MLNFFLKLLLCPGTIFIADTLSPAVNFTFAWYIILTGVIIGFLEYMADIMLLRKMGSGVSSLLDGVVAAIVVYFSQFFMPGTSIALLGALFTAVLIGIGEYITHRLILGDDYERSRQTA